MLYNLFFDQHIHLFIKSCEFYSIKVSQFHPHLFIFTVRIYYRILVSPTKTTAMNFPALSFLPSNAPPLLLSDGKAKLLSWIKALVAPNLLS